MSRYAQVGKSWLSLFCVLACVAFGRARLRADWLGFLGPGGNPVVSQGDVPLEFDVGDAAAPRKNIAWRTPLPGRSVSGPILVGGLVVTSSSSAMEERWLHVAAVDAETGAIVWQRSTKSTGRPFCHPTSANAAPTPCSDGERIFAFFSSNDLVCYDLEGNLQWFKSLTEKHPLAGNDVGMSSSPVVVDGVVVVTVECQADSFTAGLDAQTGETLWEVPRPKKANWASPRVLRAGDGRAVVVLHGLQDLMGIAPATGEVTWRLDLNCSSVASAVASEGKLYVPSNGLKVFEVESAMDEPTLAWDSTRLTPNSASLLVTPLGVIGLNRSILVCVDGQGERRWNARLKDAGQFWATPVIAGEYLYAFSMDGKCFTVKLGETGAEVVAESELGAEVLGSPAVGEEALFVRAVDALWKIAK